MSLKNENKDGYPTEINEKKLNLRLEEICHQSRNLDQMRRNLEIASACMINDNKSWAKYSLKKTRIWSKVGLLKEISEEVNIKEGEIKLKDEITLCKKGNNELMEGMITGGTQKNMK